MTDEPFTTPGHRIPPRHPKPGALLFEFVRANGAPVRVELRDHGADFGIEAQFLERGELLIGRWFDTLAVQWAEPKRKAIEAAG